MSNFSWKISERFFEQGKPKSTLVEDRIENIF